MLDTVGGLVVPELGGAGIADIADTIIPPPEKPIVGLRQGVVTALAAGTVTVQLGAGTQEALPCKYLASYIPSIGDVVWVMRQGGDLLVIGVAAGASGSTGLPKTGGISGSPAGWNNSTRLFGTGIDWVAGTVLGIGPSVVPNAKLVVTGKIRVREAIVGYGAMIAWLANYSAGTVVTAVAGTGANYVIENEVGIDATQGITNTLQFMVDMGAEGTSLLIGWALAKLAGADGTAHIQVEPVNCSVGYIGWGL